MGYDWCKRCRHTVAVEPPLCVACRRMVGADGTDVHTSSGSKQSGPASMSYCHRHNVEHAPTEPCHVCATPVEELFPGIAAWLPKCGRGPWCMGCPICEPGKVQQPSPIYTIPARDVVPGTLVDDPRLDWPTVTSVSHDGDDTLVDVQGLIYRYEPGSMERVRLPGPSPRELCCTCANHVLDPDGVITTAEPAAHVDVCPVAPVEGLHGGMRLWPAPVVGQVSPWKYEESYGHRGWWCEVSPTEGAVREWIGIYAGCRGYAEAGWCGGDRLLQAFHHPPAPPAEKPTAPGWDPYAELIDLAVRYG